MRNGDFFNGVNQKYCVSKMEKQQHIVEKNKIKKT